MGNATRTLVTSEYGTIANFTFGASSFFCSAPVPTAAMNELLALFAFLTIPLQGANKESPSHFTNACSHAPRNDVGTKIKHGHSSLYAAAHASACTVFLLGKRKVSVLYGQTVMGFGKCKKYLPQTHLVPDQTPPALPQREPHALALKREHRVPNVRWNGSVQLVHGSLGKSLGATRLRANRTFPSGTRINSRKGKC